MSDQNKQGGLVLSNYGRVLDWARDRGILTKGTPVAQAHKIVEEATEVLEAVEALNHADTGEQYEQLLSDVEIEIGDVLVTLIIECNLLDLSMNECLTAAYEKINTRKGDMVNGQFMRNRS